MLSKQERIELRKNNIGSRHRRKMKKYSDRFNEIFYFFLKSYRADILTFGGSVIEVKFLKDGVDCKEGFRLFENGALRRETGVDPNSNIEGYSRQNNILQSVMIAKSSWGLHLDMWSDGIAEWNFTEEELLETFTNRGISIPESLQKEFDNIVARKKLLRYNDEWRKAHLLD